MIDSSLWTGRDSTVHFGWRSARQRPLFMIWRCYGLKPNGDVDFARMIWATDVFAWRWQDRLRTLIKMVSGYDQSKCWVCKGDTYVYPSNPFKKAYCVDHCPEHDFQHEPGEGKMCIHCAESPPYDYYD